VAFSLSRNFWLSLPLLVWTGCGMMMQMASSNTLLQTIVEENKRGRVMSFYTMAFMGMAPFGSLLAGSLAEALGAPRTVLLGGLLTIAGAAVFARGRAPGQPGPRITGTADNRGRLPPQYPPSLAV
jgi:MFS family permease